MLIDSYLSNDLTIILCGDKNEDLCIIQRYTIQIPTVLMLKMISLSFERKTNTNPTQPLKHSIKQMLCFGDPQWSSGHIRRQEIGMKDFFQGFYLHYSRDVVVVVVVVRMMVDVAAVLGR